ncbi:rubredoxin [Mesorhizobium caraganae]|uniref:rubredoxin n=1 Tax=Mesorhizobium caraganae TaxID=483206 RepID=UPI00177B5551|nr:rubredoxin [Mesorhizobium caraganae]MBM2712892.1 rubredoxin [Mesorhizobium caraganae]
MNEPAEAAPKAIAKGLQYRSWVCTLCGFVYHERDGWPEEGIPPGTRWEDVSDDWICPDCGTAKSDFDMVEI